MNENSTFPPSKVNEQKSPFFDRVQNSCDHDPAGQIRRPLSTKVG